MVIEEVSAIQENLEIEKMCRESAEALASKVNEIGFAFFNRFLEQTESKKSV